jgi:hypothetical protein
MVIKNNNNNPWWLAQHSRIPSLLPISRLGPKIQPSINTDDGHVWYISQCYYNISSSDCFRVETELTCDRVSPADRTRRTVTLTGHRHQWCDAFWWRILQCPSVTMGICLWGTWSKQLIHSTLFLHNEHNKENSTCNPIIYIVVLVEGDLWLKYKQCIFFGD